MVAKRELFVWLSRESLFILFPISLRNTAAVTVLSKIRLLAISLVLGTSVVVGLIIYKGYRNSIADLQVEVLEQRVKSKSERLNSEFREMSHDIQLLAGLPQVRDLANAPEGAGSQDLDSLAQTLIELLEAKSSYSQARLIGLADGGREVVRVDRLGSEVIRRSGEELQQKGQHDYFLKTKELPKNEIYYSKVNLNREHGAVEVPHRPMLRVAMPIYDDRSDFWGIVVINLDFQKTIDDFLKTTEPRFGYYMVNSDGEYLVHPNKDRTFGFDLGKEFTLQKEFPDLADFFVSDLELMTLREVGVAPSETLFSIRKMHPLKDGRVFGFGVLARFDDVINTSKALIARTLLSVSAIIGVALLGTVLVSKLITNPIEKITLAAQRLGGGDDNVDLPVGRSDEIGTLAGAFGAMRDSIKKQKSKVLATNERLTRANQDLEHFSHIASHELREPITRIAGLINILELDYGKDLEEEARELMEKAKNEASNALGQITDFRIFAKLGGGVSVREEVDMDALIREVLVDFQPKIERKRVEVAIDEMPTLEVYKNLVSVLYRNLIENALKYAVGNSVSIALTCERQAEGFVFGVRNTGSSIGEKDKERVFKLFVQLGDGVEGTGIGLSICKRIVERHFGKIWVESGDDFTYFKFTLEDR